MAKMLMIGNSFSQDTMMYAPAAAASAGVELLGYNLYYGGCTLEQHETFLEEATPAPYIYEHYTPAAEQRGLVKCTLDEGLAREEWDIITFQQGSPLSGIAESYAYLDPLYAHVRAAMGDRAVRYAWNMTWAYAQGYEGESFIAYGHDQSRMFRAICHAVDTEIRPRGLTVIPCGVAIQAARTALPDASLTRDGYHLSLTCGRYTAALTMLATLLNIAPERVSFVPEGLSEQEAAVCRAAARLAAASEGK